MYVNVSKQTHMHTQHQDNNVDTTEVLRAPFFNNKETDKKTLFSNKVNFFDILVIIEDHNLNVRVLNISYRVLPWTEQWIG
jgi:hypothetical protein